MAERGTPPTRAVQTALLDWYARCRRDLPWRRRSDPYAVWVSEIMLQQTRAKTVGPYYERFLKAFPTVRSLAAAGLDDVLKLWEGLGYYRRARNLHEAARAVVAEHGGRLPRTAGELRKLPGIGDYTAGAVASIAFGADEPVVDGNVARVLARVYRIRQDITAAATRKRLWKLARELTPAGQAGLMNQALMDLGATICTPHRPSCETCPLGDGLCRARVAGVQESLPVKPGATAVPHYDIVAAVIRKRGRILIDRRREDAMLGGLWEFPGGKVRPGEAHRQALAREVAEEVGIEVAVGEPLCTVRHAYSHFRITLHAYTCRHIAGRARAIECDAVKWVLPDDLDRYAFPKANHRILERLREGLQPGGQEPCR